MMRCRRISFLSVFLTCALLMSSCAGTFGPGGIIETSDVNFSQLLEIAYKLADPDSSQNNSEGLAMLYGLVDPDEVDTWKTWGDALLLAIKAAKAIKDGLTSRSVEDVRVRAVVAEYWRAQLDTL